MKRTKIYLPFLTVFALAITLFSACKKDATTDTSGSKNLSVYLTDDPCIYDSVFIDIAYVEVKIDTTHHMDDDHFGDNDDQDGDDDHHHHDEFGVWDTLSINPGIYNIATLRNGINTLLGAGNVPPGAIRKIRITLGTNNSVARPIWPTEFASWP